mmetsp:Transcript_6382/g.24657  ORF Transcript_6382/g.24657 Transcript_6382/m.24657 type:complete len:298 (+) Transcript_6382:1531-2424(+)
MVRRGKAERFHRRRAGSVRRGRRLARDRRGARRLEPRRGVRVSMRRSRRGDRSEGFRRVRRSGQRAADGRNRRPDERLAAVAGGADRYPRGARDGVDGPGRGRAVPAHVRACAVGGIGGDSRRRRRGARHRRGERPSAHPFHAPRRDARAVPTRERRDRRVDDRARHLDRRRDTGGGDRAGDAGGFRERRRAKANAAGELGRGGDGGASVGPGRGHRRLGRGVRVHTRLFPRVRRRSEGVVPARRNRRRNRRRRDDGDKDPRARRVEGSRRRIRPEHRGSHPATRVRAGCGDSSRGR